MQGVRSISEGDYSHLPQYLRSLIGKVFLKRADTSGTPPAIQKVSVANVTLQKSKLSLIVRAKQTVINQNVTIAKAFKRKFRGHSISVEGIKRFKAASGSIGNPRVSNTVEPTSYQLQGIKGDWSDVITVCPITQQSMDVEHGTITIASSGGGGTQLHTTTTKSYDPD